ncbi:hypothetical protein [Sphingobacterium thalpophilum]|uniref:Uncharacterized protein n=1 Tax=Sphingobacterium thalpophilum TaxID=259 RepID=A0A4U9VPA8_9SPHI|nr:hypothetical protein [Sphingobacterium thalpophilum]VTR49165.1 Uncharacterised protein [Sphingobacterium thalpophilum]
MQTVKPIYQRFHEWLNNINKTEKIDNSIVAFNFGLFESEEGFTMYLNGSKIFDKEDDDWAANMDFEPKQKYFSFGTEFLKDKDWKDILKYSENLVQTYIASEDFKTSIFVQAKGVAVGFDDGDLTIIKS